MQHTYTVHSSSENICLLDLTHSYMDMVSSYLSTALQCGFMAYHYTPVVLVQGVATTLRCQIEKVTTTGCVAFSP